MPGISVEGFLYSSCIETLEVVYRIENRVAAVGIVDAEPEAWSGLLLLRPGPGETGIGVFNVL